VSDIIHLPGNIIGREDRDRLESFGGHTIARGRATRWRWDKDADGDEVFEIYRGGKDEVLVVRISRDRERDAFWARDILGGSVVSGTLEHVLAKLEVHLARLHGEEPDPAA
jgi:hypothetical protein